MTLIEQQRAFHAAIVCADDDSVEIGDERLRPGLEIYRGAYRARLLDALRATYARTAGWVGDDSFNVAASHHLISNPPRSWSLDHAGDGFAETLAGLFPADPEVAELAWLEWAMERAFTCPDVAAADFALTTAGFGEDDWTALRLRPSPGLMRRKVSSDCAAVWRSAVEGGVPPIAIQLERPATLIVWRKHFEPRFRLLDPVEADALALVCGGESFGALCEAMIERLGPDAGIAKAGALLGAWISEGVVTL